MKAADVIERLRARHPEETGEWITLVEPFNIDFFALSAWRGRAPHHRRVAYEIKCSWSDYKREIERPFKRALAVELSHQFFFAAPAELALRIQASGTLPAEAGLVRVEENRTVVTRPAPKREARGLVEREVVELLRWHHNPSKLRALAGRASHLERALEARQRTEERARAERDQAWAMLEQVDGLVMPGQRWRGRFELWRDRVEVGEVQSVADAKATVRIDGQTGATHVRVGRLVSCFEQVAA